MPFEFSDHRVAFEIKMNELVKKMWDARGEGKQHTSTQPDHNLRALEIYKISRHLHNNFDCVDIGCGTGFSTIAFAKLVHSIIGIDLSESMIQSGEELCQPRLPGLSFRVASVLELPFRDGVFDVAISTRCLINLKTWEEQKSALMQIHRVLKRDGLLFLIEGIQEGHDGLNRLRASFDLPIIQKKWFNVLFKETELLAFLHQYFEVASTEDFDMYYLVSRIVHPMLVRPQEPSFDHPVNGVARLLSEQFPICGLSASLNKMYVLRRRA